MYLMTCTRPDLAYPLSILARYVAPGRHRPEHMAAAKRVLRYLCSTSGMGLVLGGRRPVFLTGHADASWADDQAMQRSSQGYTFSLGSGSVSWRSTRSSFVLSSSCEAEIYAGAMAAQELRWLTYLLTDLGEQPRSPPVLYVDNKAMLALCREHRLEHRTKHIALRYFLARELQQRCQLRLAYVASEANTADIFTKALAPGDHQRFCTLLACFALLDWSCDPLFSPTLPMGVFLLVPNILLVHSFFLFLHTTGGAAGAGAAGGAAGAGATGGAAGAGTAGGAAGAGAARGSAGAATGGAAGAGVTGGAAGAGAAGGAAGAGASGGAAGTGAAGAAGGGTGAVSASPLPVQSQSQLQPASPLPGPSPYSRPTRGLTERREPESRPVSPVSRAASPLPIARAARVLRRRPPLVRGTHSMTLRRSTAPQRVSLPSPPASSLPYGPDPEADSFCAASPIVTRFLVTAFTDPLFESTAASALVAEGECALDTDVLEDRQEEFECFAAAVPHLVSMLLAPEGDPNAPDIPTPRSYAEAIEGPYSSQWHAAMDAEMASWNSTGTYVDEVPPPGANIVSGMWIFRVKRPPGSPPVFKARYVARGFSQRHGVDFFQTFSPTPKMTTLRVLLPVAAYRDYELHSLDFSTSFLQGSLHEEIWQRRPPGFTGTTLAALGFAPSTADPSLFLRTDASLPPFNVLVYVDDLVFATADTEALTHVNTSGMGLVLGGWARVVLTGHADASRVDDVATQRSSQGYTFSLGSGFVTWRSTRSSLVLSSSCEAEIYAGAMAAQELRWLTYLLTDLGEAPRSPPALYVDNKAMLALCQEHRLEHRTKHIALRYFLARELQQRGQLRLAYVASQANTADVFTKALEPCDHQHFCTVLGLVPTVPHLLPS
ncbi:unnamed protein product [Closterium sp. NIES-53]